MAVPESRVLIRGVQALTGVVGSLLLAGCGQNQPPALKPRPLPLGVLQVLPPTLKEGRYLVDGSMAQSGVDVAITVLVVASSPTGLEKKYALMTKRESIDCEARTIRDEAAAFFDASGKIMEAKFLTGPAGRAAGGADTEVKVACDAAGVGKGRMIEGWRAAQRDFQGPPSGLADQARARPSDAHLWPGSAVGAPAATGVRKRRRTATTPWTCRRRT